MTENNPNTDIRPADRLSCVSEYYFSRKLKEVAQLNAEGKDIISLAIGSPDMPPSKAAVDKLCEVARMTMPTDTSPQWAHLNCAGRWPDSTNAGIT